MDAASRCLLNAHSLLLTAFTREIQLHTGCQLVQMLTTGHSVENEWWLSAQASMEHLYQTHAQGSGSTAEDKTENKNCKQPRMKRECCQTVSSRHCMTTAFKNSSYDWLNVACTTLTPSLFYRAWETDSRGSTLLVDS